MKRLISLCLLCVMLFCFTACGSEEADLGDVKTLYVYNWGEYISDGSEESLDTNAAFEEYCRDVLGKNVVVNYSTFASNEDMYAKIKSGAVSYDVIIPSEYMIARMIAEDMLVPINPRETIPNYKYIDDSFKGTYFYDPDELYSVPYTFGTVGIIYNSTIVSEEDTGSWDLMWNEKYKGNILQFNNPRDAFGTAQYYLGQSVNSQNEDDWREALRLLSEQKDVVQGYVMDEIFNKMKGGSAAVSSYYAGDYFTMYGDNEDLSFYYPKEGTNIFIDAMCVPKCAQNVELAKEYINFMLSEEPAIANAEYICYASPNTLVVENEEYVEYMTEEVHPDAMDILYGFRESDVKTEMYEDLPDETRNLMNSLWEDLKIESNIGTEIYIICGAIVLFLLALLAVRIIVLRRRKAYFNKYYK